MKRRELIRHLEAHGCPLKREGASHSIYCNPATGRREPFPRHTEIPDLLDKKICRGLEIPRALNEPAMTKNSYAPTPEPDWREIVRCPEFIL